MATLLGKEGYKLLEKYNIPVSPYQRVKSESELKAAAKKFGFPIVLKAISPKILHKTEANAVQICNTLGEASLAFSQLKKKGSVLAQKFVSGTETIVGSKQDETFGPVIAFGLGGIFVEIFKDISFRVCPLTKKDASNMISEIKSYKILEGVRGKKSANLKILEEVLLKVSQMAVKENIKELDINPFMINEHAGFAVDVRIVK